MDGNDDKDVWGRWREGKGFPPKPKPQVDAWGRARAYDYTADEQPKEPYDALKDESRNE